MSFGLCHRTMLSSLVAAMIVFATPSLGQTPLRAILPVGAGSGVDTIVRSMGPGLTKALNGQPVIVENLPGAGGISGTQAIVKAAPDGNTIGVVSNNHVINPSVFKSLPYDSLKDVTPISVVGGTPFVLVVNPKKMPVKDLKEFAAALKAKPEAYNFASSGNGTVIHLAAEMLIDEIGVKATHVPYKGVGPMVTDLMGGQVDWGIVAINAVAGQVKQGTLKAIAVASPKRSPVLPDVPTAVEQGMPGFLIEGWFAFVGPAKMPPGHVKRLHAAIVAATQAPDIRETLVDKQGNFINPMTPEASAAFFKSEHDRFAKLVKKADVKVD